MKTEIEKYHACQEAVEYRKQFDTFEQAWNACPRGDWMMWIAAKAGVDKRTLTLAKGLCAETVIHLMMDKRSVKAVQTTITYGKGEATDQELAAAAATADAAAWAAAYTAAADADAVAYAAAYTAATAAATADAAAYAAAYTAAAADAAAYAAAAAAAYAAADADAADARKENQLKTANICREVLTEQVLKLIS